MTGTVPRADAARVPAAKIARYLLDPTHERGGPKCRFLVRFGFSPGEPAVLADALLGHVRAHDVASTRTDGFGNTVHRVDGALASPDGRNPQVGTVWKVGADGVPSFVTLVPGRAPGGGDEA